MLEFTESVSIKASPARVWDALLDIERWWPPSNPDHESIERLNTAGEITGSGGRVDIDVGTQFRIREKIAGVPGEGIGVVTRVDPGTAVTWEADCIRYRLYGATFTLREGVTWRVDPDEPEASLLSARVWAHFPGGLGGRILWLIFSRVLGGVEKDRHHARMELEYLKEALESAPET